MVKFYLSYVESDFKLSAPGANANSWGTTSAVKYYYVLTDNHALGAEMGYNSIESKSTFSGNDQFTSKTVGLTDMVLKYKGSYDISAATLYWGLGYSFSPEKM